MSFRVEGVGFRIPFGTLLELPGQFPPPLVLAGNKTNIFLGSVHARKQGLKQAKAPYKNNGYNNKKNAASRILIVPTLNPKP